LASFIFTRLKKAFAIILAVLAIDQISKVWIKNDYDSWSRASYRRLVYSHFTENVNGFRHGVRRRDGQIGAQRFPNHCRFGDWLVFVSITKKGAENIVIVAISLVFAGATRQHH